MNSLKSQNGFPFSSHASLRSMRRWHRTDGGRGGKRGMGAPSDPRQLMPQTGGEDALHFLHDKVQGGKQSAEELQGNQKAAVRSKPVQDEGQLSRARLRLRMFRSERLMSERTPLLCLQEMSGRVGDAFQPHPQQDR